MLMKLACYFPTINENPFYQNFSLMKFQGEFRTEVQHLQALWWRL